MAGKAGCEVAGGVAPLARGVRAGNLLVLLAAGLLFLSYGYTEMAGSDMWWHIAAGRELLQTGSLWMVKGACDLLVGSYRGLREDGRAAEVLADCRSHFPSAYLR